MDHKSSGHIHSNVHESETARLNALKKESTISLMRRIVDDSDRLALRIFHDTRTLFYYNGKWLRLAEFVITLRDRKIREKGEDESNRNYMSHVTDEAYDLTLAKFHNIPSEKHDKLISDDGTSDANGFTWGVDCRLYFKYLLENIDTELKKKQVTSEADIEAKVASIANGFVRRHFYLSLKECRRRDTTSIRHPWEVNGRIIYLFRPSHLTAKQFRDWLEKHITDFNPDDPYEKNRIQEIIDQKYSRGVIVPDDDPEIAKELGIIDKDRLELNEGNQFSDRLSVYVAKEKSCNLEKLRPAIKKLGKENVYNLVNRIFKDMVEEQYNLSEVARHFSLSKATLSRFAGSEWFEDRDQQSRIEIPDLWANTARVLAKHPQLMETVRTSGFAGAIEEILKMITPKKEPKNERQ